MQHTKHLYSFSYDTTESALSKLESKCIFKQEDHNKFLFSDITIHPADSAFIKSRIDIIAASADYDTLITSIQLAKICKNGFKIEYIVSDTDTTEYAVRLNKLRDIGYSINGIPEYHHPTTTYAVCFFQNVWCFGILIKNKFDWYKHRQKPHAYSHSIGSNIAKALIHIATQGNKRKTLLDACCGVGTILLEGCFAGNSIEGCDINSKICDDARANLSHFKYHTHVHCSDIKHISKHFDAAIIDLPYNLMSIANEQDLLHIIQSTGQIANRLVIVSTTNIANLIEQIGFTLLDFCSVNKRGKGSFARKIWVCERRLPQSQAT